MDRNTLLTRRLSKLFTEGTNIERLNNLIPSLKQERYSRSKVLSYLRENIPEVRESMSSTYPLFLSRCYNEELVKSLLSIAGYAGSLSSTGIKGVDEISQCLMRLYSSYEQYTVLSSLLKCESSLSPALALLDAVLTYEAPELDYNALSFERGKSLCLDTGLLIPCTLGFQRKYHDKYLGFMSDSEMLYLQVQWHLTGDTNLEHVDKALSMILREGRGKRYIDIDELREVNSTTTGKKACSDHVLRFTTNNSALFAYIGAAIDRSPRVEKPVVKKEKEKEGREKGKRKKIPGPVRLAVWKAHCGEMLTGSCFCCETELKFESWECGHIVSDACEGTIDLENLRPLCLGCNRSMGKENMYDYIIKNGLPGAKRVPAVAAMTAAPAVLTTVAPTSPTNTFLQGVKGAVNSILGVKSKG